jgi:outer membrane immunogenic protein
MSTAFTCKRVPGSRWLALGALAMTLAGPVYGFGQQATSQEEMTADQSAVQPAVGNNVVLVAVTAPAPAPAVTAPAAPVDAPPPPASGSYRWTGFYIGVHIGHGSGSADTAFNPLPTAAQFVNLAPQTLHPDPSGVLGGGQFGVNWQHGHFVLGVEFDISASGMDGTKTITPIIQNNGTPFPGAGFVSAHQDTNWVAAVRPRVGVTLVPRLLVYGTGGVAFASVTQFAITNFRPVGTTEYPAFIDGTKTGWIAGGGAEVALARRWSVRGEYLHYNLGSDSKTVNAIPLLPPFQVGYTFADITANTFNFGVNFRF